jgi:hypothetical protein
MKMSSWCCVSLVRTELLGPGEARKIGCYGNRISGEIVDMENGGFGNFSQNNPIREVRISWK